MLIFALKFLFCNLIMYKTGTLSPVYLEFSKMVFPEVLILVGQVRIVNTWEYSQTKCSNSSNTFCPVLVFLNNFDNKLNQKWTKPMYMS